MKIQTFSKNNHNAAMDRINELVLFEGETANHFTIASPEHEGTTVSAGPALSRSNLRRLTSWQYKNIPSVTAGGLKRVASDVPYLIFIKQIERRVLLVRLEGRRHGKRDEHGRFCYESNPSPLAGRIEVAGIRKVLGESASIDDTIKSVATAELTLQMTIPFASSLGPFSLSLNDEEDTPGGNECTLVPTTKIHTVR
jgi:hypothetical protein